MTSVRSSEVLNEEYYLYDYTDIVEQPFASKIHSLAHLSKLLTQIGCAKIKIFGKKQKQDPYSFRNKSEDDYFRYEFECDDPLNIEEFAGRTGLRCLRINKNKFVIFTTFDEQYNNLRKKVGVLDRKYLINLGIPGDFIKGLYHEIEYTDNPVTGALRVMNSRLAQFGVSIHESPSTNKPVEITDFNKFIDVTSPEIKGMVSRSPEESKQSDAEYQYEEPLQIRKMKRMIGTLLAEIGKFCSYNKDLKRFKIKYLQEIIGYYYSTGNPLVKCVELTNQHIKDTKYKAKDALAGWFSHRVKDLIDDILHPKEDLQNSVTFQQS